MLWSTVDQGGTPKQAVTAVEAENSWLMRRTGPRAGVSRGAGSFGAGLARRSRLSLRDRVSSLRPARLAEGRSAVGPGQLAGAGSAAGHPEHLARLNLIG